ncbi:DUF6446 family protein [Ascidiaceihabitans sp.]|nr:histidine kinase [Paracoccaceae bacterium]MDB4074690.1 DUF6446 family protein [Ascidiaceihabitans sp.]MDC1320289.1 DUF6446 family protein [bacterium]HCI08234.1 histidine kinase [Sulfitobacter sp.]MDB9945790.1 DUF6446 family protein [Ascidiaceihabitans sp.]
MMGKFLAVLLLGSAVIAGASMYYLQVYGLYDEVKTSDVQLVSVVDDLPETISFDNFQAIDSQSSPIRYRACFTTDLSISLLSETYVGLEKASPRNAPKWFDCFDAAAIGAELAAGTAVPFLGQKNVHFGVDRIVAITDDGRGYIWHDLNDCGDKAYDGTIVGEECPGREATE